MKNVLVTGGAGGLGLAAVKQLAGSGYQVFSCDIVKSDFEHGNVRQFVMDIRDSASVQAVFNAVSAQAGSLDAVIHLAGVYAMDSFIEIDEEELTNFLNIHFMGVYRVNKTFLPLLMHGGRIIVTTSEVAGLKPFPFNGIYSLAKTALEHYAQALRLELCLLDIPVVELKPGAFRTNLTGSTGPALERMIAKTNLYRMNAQRFKDVMESEIGTALEPEVLAVLIDKIVQVPRPRPVYTINTSMKLKLFSILPIRMQVWVIKKILK
jgi:NAD(P)-dependent dehydrogenase (short-subunit alcohol dehydrogenase family)